MVDFTLTDEQKSMREMAHDFAEKEIRPVAWDFDRDGTWPQEIIDKILLEREILGIDRFIGQIDLGGLPPRLVNRSIELLATEVAPALRQATAASPMMTGRKT